MLALSYPYPLDGLKSADSDLKGRDRAVYNLLRLAREVLASGSGGGALAPASPRGGGGGEVGGGSSVGNREVKGFLRPLERAIREAGRGDMSIFVCTAVSVLIFFFSILKLS